MKTKNANWIIFICLLTLGIGFPDIGFGDPAAQRDIIYVYPGGFLVGQFADEEKALQITVQSLSDDLIESGDADLGNCKLIYTPGIRFLSNKERFVDFFVSAQKQYPNLPIITGTRGYGSFKRALPEFTEKGIVEADSEVEKYTDFNNISRENLRKLLIYLAVTYLDRSAEIEPPEDNKNRWFYHPDHEDAFESVEELLTWSRSMGRDLDAPRALIETHYGQLMINKIGIDALIRQFEKMGVLAAGINTIDDAYEEQMRQFQPDLLMIWTGKSGDLDYYQSLGVPRLQPMFLMGETIEQWNNPEDDESKKKRRGGRMGGMLVTRESLGIIEPHVVAGPVSDERNFSAPRIPIPDRVERFVTRGVKWAELARKQNRDKRVAIQYLGPPDKGEMLLGTIDSLMGESMIRLLERIQKDGYTLNSLPESQDELIDWMIDHGHQILSSNPDELDRLARSGKAALVPVETYRQWFEAKVPQAEREAVIEEWGEIPGEFMVWENDRGEQFLVIPKIDLGNIILVPKQFPEIEGLLGQENREALLEQLREDPYGIVPSHNELAANFWIEEGFKADALIVWGFFIMDYCLPRKTICLRESDWPDILMGNMPNIRPWPICELHWSLPARRRTYAVLTDHLTSPDATAGLADELLNLSGDIIKWDMLPEGALEEKFRVSITKQTLEAGLDKDLHLNLDNNRILDPDEVRSIAGYLNEIQHEKINTNYHVLGQTPPDDQLIPWIVTCLGRKFIEGLEETIPVPSEKDRLPGDRKNFLRLKGEEVVESILIGNLSISDAVLAAGGKIDRETIPAKLKESIESARQLSDGFAGTHQEIDNVLVALAGKFVPPGPANLPERNPSVLPTGRNMYIMNPEEIPSRPSWELAKHLVDQLLAEKIETNGRYPEKIGLSLNFRSTLMDYGVLESQILYLIGVRPVWDRSNRVLDIELIPISELGRPRIDVFIETYDYYADYLESRLRLWDKAIRMVSMLDEPDNYLFQNRNKVLQDLQANGIPRDRAEILSRARIFAMAPELVSLTHFFLLEETGDWDSRRELVDVYLAERDYVYTDGIWGEKNPDAYRHQLEGTEVVLRNVTRGGPLFGAWYNGGNLCLVIKELTGKDPEYFLSDLRTPGDETIVRAEDALRKDFRATLFNRKWIEETMQEDYSGAQQIAGSVFSTLGWKINRDNSITDDIWEEIVEIYLHDKKNLNIREWFDKQNPYAFQGMSENLLEAVRKEYWRPAEETVLEIASAYAESVVRHGHSEPGEVNEKLEMFLGRILSAPGSESKSAKAALELLNQYREKTAEELQNTIKKTEPVEGVKIEPAQTESEKNKQDRAASADQPIPKDRNLWLYIVAGSALTLFLLGLWRRVGAPR